MPVRPKKKHELTAGELAMRGLLLVQRMAKGDAWLMGDMADRMIDEFGVSRAAAYKIIRTAIDVLAISYHKTPERIGRRHDKWSAAWMFRRSNERRAA